MTSRNKKEKKKKVSVVAIKNRPKKWASLRMIADLLLLTDQRINQLVKEGVMKRVARGQYDLKQCVQDYVRYLNLRIRDAKRGDMSESQARTELLKTQDRLKRIELAYAEKEIINRADVKAALEGPLKATRDKLISLPRRLAPEIPAIESATEAEEFLEKRIEECLYELVTIPNTIGRMVSVAKRDNTGSLEDFKSTAEANNQSVVGSVPSIVKRKQR